MEGGNCHEREKQQGNRLPDLQEVALPVGNKDGVFGFGIILNKVECYD